MPARPISPEDDAILLYSGTPWLTQGAAWRRPSVVGSTGIGPGHIGLRLARCESGKGLLALMGGQLARAAELDAAILGTLAALAGAGTDQQFCRIEQSRRV